MSSQPSTSKPPQAANWTPYNTSIFIDEAIKVVEAGLRPVTCFILAGWQKLSENIAKESGNEYTKRQLKNKWDALKNEWKLWKELLNKETGLGWSSSKGTFDDSDEWWDNKIQINSEYSRLRKKGIAPELEEKYDKMFVNTIATDIHAWTPSSGSLPQINEEGSTDDASGDSDDARQTNQALKKSAKKGKKRASDTVEPKMKGKKVGGASKLSSQIDNLVEVLKSRSSTATSLKQQSGASIPELMEIVASIPECELPSLLWLFATRLFLMKERERCSGS